MITIGIIIYVGIWVWLAYEVKNTPYEDEHFKKD